MLFLLTTKFCEVFLRGSTLFPARPVFGLLFPVRILYSAEIVFLSPTLVLFFRVWENMVSLVLPFSAE